MNAIFFHHHHHHHSIFIRALSLSFHLLLSMYLRNINLSFMYRNKKKSHSFAYAHSFVTWVSLCRHWIEDCFHLITFLSAGTFVKSINAITSNGFHNQIENTINEFALSMKICVWSWKIHTFCFSRLTNWLTLGLFFKLNVFFKLIEFFKLYNFVHVI